MLTGKAGGCDNTTTYVWLAHAENVDAFDFGFDIKAKWYQIIAVEVDGQRYRFSRGHWKNAASQIFIAGKKEDRVAGAVERPDEWASMKVVLEQNKLTYYYNGVVAGSSELVKPTTKASTVKVGFSSHETEISVKDIYLLKR
jgi:hypothetical protein